MLDETNDKKLRSWVESANDEACDFPIQNLPFGSFSTADAGRRLGVAIGDQVLDLREAVHAGLLDLGDATDALRQPTLNPFMSAGQDAWVDLRRQLSHLLRAQTPTLRDNAELRERLLRATSDVTCICHSMSRNTRISMPAGIMLSTLARCSVALKMLYRRIGCISRSGTTDGHHRSWCPARQSAALWDRSSVRTTRFHGSGLPPGSTLNWKWAPLLAPVRTDRFQSMKRSPIFSATSY